MSVRALYPGTFDPPTNGHVDLIQRGAKLFEHLTVGILRNPVKNPLFTVEERVEMLIEATSALGNVSIATFDGLMVDFARQQEANAVLRGIRAISDYEHEFQMALMNRRLAPEVETVFLQPAGRYSFVSSRMVKEVFSFGGDVSGLVPPTSSSAYAPASPRTELDFRISNPTAKLRTSHACPRLCAASSLNRGGNMDLFLLRNFHILRGRKRRFSRLHLCKLAQDIHDHLPELLKELFEPANLIV